MGQTSESASVDVRRWCARVDDGERCTGKLERVYETGTVGSKGKGQLRAHYTMTL